MDTKGQQAQNQPNSPPDEGSSPSAPENISPPQGNKNPPQGGNPGVEGSSPQSQGKSTASSDQGNQAQGSSSQENSKPQDSTPSSLGHGDSQKENGNAPQDKSSVPVNDVSKSAPSSNQNEGQVPATPSSSDVNKEQPVSAPVENKSMAAETPPYLSPTVTKQSNPSSNKTPAKNGNSASPSDVPMRTSPPSSGTNVEADEVNNIGPGKTVEYYMSVTATNTVINGVSTEILMTKKYANIRPMTFRSDADDFSTSWLLLLLMILHFK
eukprot:NODE_584_length_6418_cov_0.079601.p3 type:complete len:267 gc:universal NODE_584_length_6418_cov_0.079601:1344-2144(+)